MGAPPVLNPLLVEGLCILKSLAQSYAVIRSTADTHAFMGVVRLCVIAGRIATNPLTVAILNPYECWHPESIQSKGVGLAKVFIAFAATDFCKLFKTNNLRLRAFLRSGPKSNVLKILRKK